MLTLTSVAARLEPIVALVEAVKDVTTRRGVTRLSTVTLAPSVVNRPAEFVILNCKECGPLATVVEFHLKEIPGFDAAQFAMVE